MSPRLVDPPAEEPRDNLVHPMQPIGFDAENIIRFKCNAIVRFLLDAGPFDMNQLACMPFRQEDREQFAQLIGYSVSGFGDLSYASEEAVRKADRLAEQLLKRAGQRPKRR